MQIRIDVDAEVDYEVNKPERGCFDENGNYEKLNATVNIKSVTANGIDIINLLDADQIEELESEILEKENNGN